MSPGKINKSRRDASAETLRHESETCRHLGPERVALQAQVNWAENRADRSLT